MRVGVAQNALQIFQIIKAVNNLPLFSQRAVSLDTVWALLLKHPLGKDFSNGNL